MQNEVNRLITEKNYSNIELISDTSMSDLIKRLKTLHKDSAVLLSFFARDNQNNFFEYNEGIPLITENSSVPVYAMWDFALNQGTLGGIVIDSYKYGVETAEMGLQILNGKNADQIPVVYNSPTTLIFDYLILEKYNINNYKKLSPKLINNPASFFHENRDFVISTIIIFVLLLIAVYGLSVGLIESNKAHKEVKTIALDYSTLANNIPGVTYRCKYDDNFTMLIIGDGIIDITGYSSEDFLGEKRVEFNELIHKEDKDEVYKIITDAIEKRQQYAIEYRINNKNGQIHWIMEKGRAIFNNEESFLYIDALLLDITHQKKVEMDLDEHRKHLEEMVSDRTEELKASLDNLKDTQNQLIETSKMASLGMLVSGVAHEINTPAGICLTSDTFINETVGDIIEKVNSEKLNKTDLESALTRVDEASYLSISNLNKIIDIIKIFKQMAVDQNSEDARIFNVKEYFSDSFTQIYENNRNKKVKINFICPDDIIIKSYPGVLAGIFSYLISNSVEHGFIKNSDNNTISIEFIKNYSNIEIIYKDNGVGIDTKIINKIFEPFYTTQRGKGHQGLGLNIVYNMIAHKLSGTINYVKMDNSSGTEFIINFPV